MNVVLSVNKVFQRILRWQLDLFINMYFGTNQNTYNVIRSVYYLEDSQIIRQLWEMH